MSAEPHWFGSRGPGSKGKGHPVMFNFSEAEYYGDFPDGGGYPIGFLRRAFEIMEVDDPDAVLHLCSGSLLRGVTVDIRPDMNPTVCCDARHTPFPDASFRWILMDPPYSEEYARNLYGTGDAYPQPGELLREATRLLVPGGRVGLLHFQVPMFRKPLRLLGVWGITTGLGYAIRAFSVMEKMGEATAPPERPRILALPILQDTTPLP